MRPKKRHGFSAAAMLLRPVALTAPLCEPARAQTADAWKCTGRGGIPWDEQIAGCTDAINSAKFSGTDLAAIFNSRGTAYLVKGDLDHAIGDYDQAIGLNPGYAVAFNNRGFAYGLERNFDHAIADFDQAIRLNPNYALAFRNRGNVYMAKEEESRLSPDYTTAIRLNPDNGALY